MKNVYFNILFTFVATFSINAQESYIPILVQGNQWNEVNENHLDSPYHYKRTYITTLGKDTVIDGLSYSELLTTVDSLAITKEKRGYIREDITSQKVYYKPVDKPEYLLYAFDVQVGDTLHSYDRLYGDSILNTVKAIDTLFAGNAFRKKITIQTTVKIDSSDEYHYFEYPYLHEWIEGIGDIKEGFIWYYSVCSGCGFTSLLCFYQNDELVYKPEETEVEGCFVWKYLNETNIKQISSGCFFKQADNTLFISLEKHADFTISIINMEGKIVLGDSGSGNKFQINISRLPAGMYVVNIQSGNQIVNHKIIKQYDEK